MGVMSTILGALSLASIITVLILSYKAAGEGSRRLGATLFIALAFSISGLFIGAISKTKHDSFMLFCYLGIVLNLIAFFFDCVILYLGIY